MAMSVLIGVSEIAVSAHAEFKFGQNTDKYSPICQNIPRGIV